MYVDSLATSRVLCSHFPLQAATYHWPEVVLLGAATAGSWAFYKCRASPNRAIAMGAVAMLAGSALQFLNAGLVRGDAAYAREAATRDTFRVRLYVHDLDRRKLVIPRTYPCSHFWPCASFHPVCAQCVLRPQPWSGGAAPQSASACCAGRACRPRRGQRLSAQQRASPARRARGCPAPFPAAATSRGAPGPLRVPTCMTTTCPLPRCSSCRRWHRPGGG